MNGLVEQIEDYIRTSVNDLGYELIIGPSVRIDQPDWVTGDMTWDEHERFRQEYSVSVGEMIRFDNLPVSTKVKVFDLSEGTHHLTLGKLYKVEGLDITPGREVPRFGKSSKVHIRDDRGILVPHYRGRFNKLNVSMIPEPNDDDII